MPMQEDYLAQSSKQISRVTYIGVFVNIVLAVIKITIGSLSGSIALVADGIHSLSDMVTDAVVLLGIHLGNKAPDRTHPYGHGRLETFSALTVAIILLCVGAFMIYESSLCMINIHLGKEEVPVLGMAVLYAATISVVAKEALYWVTRKVAVVVHSPALYANAWHHRTDAASSIAVVIGFIALKFGYDYGDQVAAVVVGLMIIIVGAKIVRDCMEEFAERAADSDTIEQIKDIIESEKRIRGWHKLRTRNVGRQIFLDLHILVDPQLSITEAHEISEALEASMHKKITRPVNITVHIEPYQPHMER